MKEHYLKEMQKIHVPESLIEKTKLAMKEEEQRIHTEKENKKIVPFGRISMAAVAAILLLVLVPAAAGNLGAADEGSMQQSQVYLASKEEAEVFKIEAETEEQTGLGAVIKEIIDKIGELLN